MVAKLKAMKEKTKNKKTNVHDTASKLYDELLETYFDEYCYLSDPERKKVDCKYKPKKLFLKGYDDSVWSQSKEESTYKEELTDKKESVNLSDMSLVEGDEEEVNEGKEKD